MGSSIESVEVGRKPEPQELELALKEFEKGKRIVDKIKPEVAGLKAGECLVYSLEGLHGDMFRIVLTLAERLSAIYRVWKYFNEVYIMRVEEKSD